MRKTTHALAVPTALLLAAGIAACGDPVPVSPSTVAASPAAQETPGNGTKPTTSSNEAETISVMQVKVGDCFNYDDTATQVTSVEIVSCDSPHTYEAYNNYAIDDSKYSTIPTDDEFKTEFSNACYDSFTMYVGIPYESSIYNVTSLQPTSRSWAKGDRTIICLIISQDGKPLTGSARNSNK